MAKKQEGVNVADDGLAAAVKRASEIAEAVPKHLQEAAFNRALDQLLKASGAADEPRQRSRAPKSRSRSSQAKRGKKERASADDGVLDMLLRELDRTQYPEISSDKKALPNALAVLRAAKRDHAVDGLQPPQIARILTEKFRISTGDSTVSMALGSAGKYVNRVQIGRGYTYRLMGPGEKYLDAPTSVEPTRGGESGSTVGKRTTSKKGSADDHGKTTPRRPRSSGSRPGPKVAVDSLIKTGFFAEPRLLGDVQAHLQVDRGYAYAVTDLSPTMTRAVRSGGLKRTRRQDGQYEYQAG